MGRIGITHDTFLTVIMSVSALVLYLRINLPGRWANTAIFLGEHGLAVYLIHEHDWARTTIYDVLRFNWEEFRITPEIQFSNLIRSVFLIFFIGEGIDVWRSSLFCVGDSCWIKICELYEWFRRHGTIHAVLVNVRSLSRKLLKEIRIKIKSIARKYTRRLKRWI
jgi:hypothetical protein